MDCPPKACRKKESTTTMRVNEVNIISTAGKKERKLINRNIWINGLSISFKSIACAVEASAKTENRINTPAITAFDFII
jgi:hypothetical protein